MSCDTEQHKTAQADKHINIHFKKVRQYSSSPSAVAAIKLANENQSLCLHGRVCA